MKPNAGLGNSFTWETPPKTTKNSPTDQFLIVSKVFKHVMSSAAEAEIGAVFINAKEGAVLRTTLEELGHKQPPTPMDTDNTTATGYINGTIKQKRTKAMDMRFYWIKDRVKQGQFKIDWGPGFLKSGGLLHKTPFAGTSQMNTRRIHPRRRTTYKSERNSRFRIARVY
jgi:hypothetical protein